LIFFFNSFLTRNVVALFIRQLKEMKGI
jgi:hypothetical protein